MLDYGVIALEAAMITLRGKHLVSAASICYHNEKIYGKSDQVPTLIQEAALV
jgi:hypothetical protein